MNKALTNFALYHVKEFTDEEKEFILENGIDAYCETLKHQLTIYSKTFIEKHISSILYGEGCKGFSSDFLTAEVIR